MNGQKQVPNQLQSDGASPSAVIQAHPNQPINITNSHCYHGPTYSFAYDFRAPGDYFIGNDVRMVQERAPQRASTPNAINRASDSVQDPSPFGSSVMSPLFAKGASGVLKSVSTPKSGTSGANRGSQSPE